MDKQAYFSILKQLHDICRNNPSPKLVAMDAYNEIINFLYLRHLSDNDDSIEEQYNLRTLYEKYCTNEKIEQDLENKEYNKFNGLGNRKELFFEKLSGELLPGLNDNTRNGNIAFTKIMNQNLQAIQVDVGRLTNIMHKDDGSSIEDGGQKAQKLINKIYSKNFLPLNDEGKFHMGLFPYDAVGEGFEKFMSDAGASGGNWGQYFTNPQIIEWIFKNVKAKPNHKVIDPFAGSGGFLLKAKKEFKIERDNIEGHEYDDKIFKFLRFNANIANLNPDNMGKGDTYDFHNYLKDRENQYDRIYTNPPFGESIDIPLSNPGLKKFWGIMKTGKSVVKNSMGLAVYAIYKMLKPGGIAAFVTERGFLNNGTEEKKKTWEKRLRKEIIENCNVSEILLLPKGIFSHTNFDTAVIIFQKCGEDEEGNVVEKTSKITYHRGYFDKKDKGTSNKKMHIDENFLETTHQQIVEKEWSLKYDDYVQTEEVEQEGIEYKTLGEVCEFHRGKALTINKMKGGDFQVIGGGKGLMDNFYHKYNTSENQILISNDGSYAGFVNKFDKKLFITSHCNKCIVNEDILNNDYLYYYLKIKLQKRMITHENSGGFQKGNAQPSINLIKLSKENIPILSPEHQERIVNFMDEFVGEDYGKLDQLVSKFPEADLFNILIREDYDGFRSLGKYYDDIISLENHLKSFSTDYKRDIIRGYFKTVPAEIKTLGEVCEFKKGNMITKNKLVKGEYPVIGGGKSPFGYHNKFNKKENTILCSQSGAYAGYISKYNIKVWASDCFSIHSKLLNEIYLYKYLSNIQDKIYLNQTGQAQPHYSMREAKYIKIPVPSLEDQQKVLDMIEAIDAEDSQYNQMLDGIKSMIETVYQSVTNITT